MEVGDPWGWLLTLLPGGSNSCVLWDLAQLLHFPTRPLAKWRLAVAFWGQGWLLALARLQVPGWSPATSICRAYLGNGRGLARWWLGSATATRAWHKCPGMCLKAEKRGFQNSVCKAVAIQLYLGEHQLANLGLHSFETSQSLLCGSFSS